MRKAYALHYSWNNPFFEGKFVCWGEINLRSFNFIFFALVLNKIPNFGNISFTGNIYLNILIIKIYDIIKILIFERNEKKLDVLVKLSSFVLFCWLLSSVLKFCHELCMFRTRDQSLQAFFPSFPRWYKIAPALERHTYLGVQRENFIARTR